MAHRLRRVVAINIRNATTKAPSQQVAMLDLRAHTLAVGDNGVGKTSFMRLIPLFYGAAPERILRGSQKSSLIGYTLPAPSSTIAFEYERQSEDDLRLVVVHGRPGTEQAEFYIVPTGYREDYFVDENNQFVERHHFKRRLEDMGIDVSPRLQLHQYRSVILNERRPTKDGIEMRQLAARHALGPRTLHGMDLIAVAMTGERLSFRDLQNLVLDRLSDTGYEGVRGSNAKTLRKDRGVIETWLANVRHARKVFAQEGQAKRIRELIVSVRKSARELGSLREATARSVQGRQAALIGIEREVQAHEMAIQRFEQEGSVRYGELSRASEETETAWHTARNALTDVQRKAASFADLGAQQLSEQQDQESQFRHNKLSADQELKTLQALAGEAGSELETALATIEMSNRNRVKQIEEERVAGNDEHAAALSDLEDEREKALARFDADGPPVRLAKLDALLSTQRDEAADHRALAKTADAPQRALENLEQTQATAKNAQADLEQCTNAVLAAKEAAALADTQARDLILNLERAEDAEQAAGAHHFLLSEQLSPPPGSVLAALRAQPLEAWSDTAKVLDPTLLLRKDLQPHLGAGAQSSEQHLGTILVGALALDTTPVDLPIWANEDSARAQLKAAAAELEAATKELSILRGRIKTVQTAQRDACEQVDLAKSALARAEITRNEANGLVDQASRHLEVERQRVRQEHASLASVAQSQVEALAQEQFKLTQEHAQARGLLERQFTEQRTALNHANKQWLERLANQKEMAVEHASQAKCSAEAQHALALAGKGVDPQALDIMQKRITKLEETLNEIAGHRHTVKAWREFELRDAPRLPQLEFKESQASQRKDHSLGLLRRHIKETELERVKLNAQAANLQARKQKDCTELDQLQELLAELAPYTAAGRMDLSDGLHADLSAQVKREKRTLGDHTEALMKATRSLADLMRERPGAIQHYLDNHEAERDRGLGDKSRMLEFELACWRGQTVTDWFDPLAHRDHLVALRHEMGGYLSMADAFVSEIDRFEERVRGLHGEFQAALRRTAGFQRFGDLSISITSTASNSPAVKALRQMKHVSQSRVSSWRTSMAADPTLPDDDEMQLVQTFKEHLPDGGVLQVNLDEQVRLSFKVSEMGNEHDIQNERDMQGLSSTGLTVLITMMFLLGFVGIVRGPDSPVGLAWVLDEVGRVSPTNMVHYLEVLSQQGITAVCAAPSSDPALLPLFASTHAFEDDGSIARRDFGALGVVQ